MASADEDTLSPAWTSGSGGGGGTSDGRGGGGNNVNSVTQRFTFKVDPHIMEDDGPSSKREKPLLRKQCEKLRRDRLNAYIGELAKIVPLVMKSNKKIDKASVLRLTVAYLRIYYDLIISHRMNKQQKQQDQSVYDSLANQLLDTFGGFLLVVNTNGILVYATESISRYLGYNLVDILGCPITRYVHPDDHSLLQRQFELLSTDLLLPDDEDSGDIGHVPVRGQRSFTVHMQNITDPQNVSYDAVHVVGHIRTMPDTSLYSVAAAAKRKSEVCLVAVATMMPSTFESISEMPPADEMPNQWITRHELDGKITYSDQRGALLTGFLPSESIGLSPYSLVHPEDIPTMVSLHNYFLMKGGLPKSVFRMFTKSRDVLYIGNSTHLVSDMWTAKPKFIISINEVLDPEKGEEKLDKQYKFVASLAEQGSNGIVMSPGSSRKSGSSRFSDCSSSVGPCTPAEIPDIIEKDTAVDVVVDQQIYTVDLSLCQISEKTVRTSGSQQSGTSSTTIFDPHATRDEGGLGIPLVQPKFIGINDMDESVPSQCSAGESSMPSAGNECYVGHAPSTTTLSSNLLSNTFPMSVCSVDSSDDSLVQLVDSAIPPNEAFTSPHEAVIQSHVTSIGHNLAAANCQWNKSSQGFTTPGAPVVQRLPESVHFTPEFLPSRDSLEHPDERSNYRDPHPLTLPGFRQRISSESDVAARRNMAACQTETKSANLTALSTNKWVESVAEHHRRTGKGVVDYRPAEAPSTIVRPADAHLTGPDQHRRLSDGGTGGGAAHDHQLLRSLLCQAPNAGRAIDNPLLRCSNGQLQFVTMPENANSSASRAAAASATNAGLPKPFEPPPTFSRNQVLGPTSTRTVRHPQEMTSPPQPAVNRQPSHAVASPPLNGHAQILPVHKTDTAGAKPANNAGSNSFSIVPTTTSITSDESSHVGYVDPFEEYCRQEMALSQQRRTGHSFQYPGSNGIRRADILLSPDILGPVLQYAATASMRSRTNSQTNPVAPKSTVDTVVNSTNGFPSVGVSDVVTGEFSGSTYVQTMPNFAPDNVGMGFHEASISATNHVAGSGSSSFVSAPSCFHSSNYVDAPTTFAAGFPTASDVFMSSDPEGLNFLDAIDVLAAQLDPSDTDALTAENCLLLSQCVAEFDAADAADFSDFVDKFQSSSYGS